MPLSPEEKLELDQLKKEYEVLNQEINPTKVMDAPDTGFWEAGARGVAQGLTFDFADEITASIESALTGKPYDQALKESRAEYEANKEEYPITSFVGGLAGGVGQAAIVGGLTGGAGAVASGASKLGKLKELTRAVFLPKAGESALKNIATAAGTSAAMSGITAVGASEKEGLERLEGVPGAALTGGFIGGGLGGLVEGGKFVGGKAFEKLKKMGGEGKLPYSAKKVLDIVEASKEGTFKSRKGESLEDIAKLHGTSVEELMDLNPKLKETYLDFTNLPEGIEIKVPGQGYIQQRSSEAVDAKLEDASERIVERTQETLDQARNLKTAIISNVDEKFVPEAIENLKLTLENLGSLAQIHQQDAVPSFNFVKEKLNQIEMTGGKEKLSIQKLDGIINEFSDLIEANKKKGISVEVQKPLIKANEVLKSYLRANVSDIDMMKAFEKIPDVANEYRKLIKRLPEKEYAEFLKRQLKETEEGQKFFGELSEAVRQKKLEKGELSAFDDLTETLNQLKEEEILRKFPEELADNIKTVIGKIKRNKTEVKNVELKQVNKLLEEFGEAPVTLAELYGDKGIREEILRLVAESKKLKKAKVGAMMGFSEEDIAQILEARKQAIEEMNKQTKELSFTSPLAKLDSVMSNILAASENLGGITRGKSEQKRIFKVLDTLRAKETDTAGGQKALYKYNDFLSNLRKADPDLAAEVERVANPAVMALENKRFLEGAKLGESPREVGALRTLVSVPLQAAALGGSLAAQVKAPRLGNYALQKMRDKVGAELKRTPNSPTMLAASKFLDNALSTSDEGRRAAILNTLNQYKQFRELFKDEEFEEK